MKYSVDLTFVEKYNYPERIKEHFREILSHIDESKVESVILTGSTSRGELSYRTTDERFIIYSDYEFLIVSKGKIDAKDVDRLEKAYRKLEDSFSDNPLFHIDFSYIDVKFLRSLPPHLKHYETKKNGVVVYGRDLLHLIPEITLKTLDFKDLNEILIWRLWAMLLYFPKEIALAGKNDTENQNVYKYVLCRNLLDLTTWILPLKNVLLHSFKERYAYLKGNFGELQDSEVIDNRFLKLMEECMIGKFEMEFKRSLLDIYADVTEYFLRAKKHLLNVHYMSTDDAATIRYAIETNSGKLFHDYQYKRKGFETLLFLKNHRDMGILRGVRWILRGKYGLMLEFLSQIHMAMASNLSNDKERASYCLDIASSILQKLSVRNAFKLENREFGKSWQTLRRGFANFLVEYFPTLGIKKDYINSVLD